MITTLTGHSSTTGTMDGPPEKPTKRTTRFGFFSFFLFPGASLPLSTHPLVKSNLPPPDAMRHCAFVADALRPLTSLGLSGLVTLTTLGLYHTGSCLALWALTALGLLNCCSAFF